MLFKKDQVEVKARRDEDESAGRNGRRRDEEREEGGRVCLAMRWAGEMREDRRRRMRNPGLPMKLIQGRGLPNWEGIGGQGA